MASDVPHTLQYVPFNSSVDAGFWHTLIKKKLNEYGLDESLRSISGFYSNANAANMPPQINVEYTAFNSEQKPPPRNLLAPGFLLNTNTVEAFKEMDKKKLLNSIGCQMWSDIKSGVMMLSPEKLGTFVLLTFADLKKYHFYYWFGFPALKFPETVHLSEPPVAVGKTLSPSKLESLIASYDTFQKERESFANFFIVTECGESYSIQDFSKLNQDNISQERTMIGVCDPSSVAGFPGWPVRNLISLLAYRFGTCVKRFRILCVRDRIYDGTRDFGQSLVLNVESPQATVHDSTIPECVGWEKNERSKMGPRMVNLSSSMDPNKLAEGAVDLNLRLMRWRLLPDLDLEKLSSTRCLVLGSGTLGCNVARLLMAWGMRHITMVDNSKVSFSNPVRQTLFTFSDCLDGGKPKAQAASDSLRTIFPGMQTTGVSLSIPMPGHMVPDSVVDEVKKDVETLETLIESHDAVFLLMDTRESRWLPTLIAAVKKKIVINAALGFDSYLVLRHGLKTEIKGKEEGPISLGGVPGNQLGCYFCNDVVAPGDSTRDRTLDQQCTVTRPGVSMMAAALAVELLVSVLQHPKGGEARAETGTNDSRLSEEESCLGIIPHQIRGFLSQFHQILPAGQAFAMCTACSPVIMDKYQTEGFAFLQRVFNESGFLEEVSGLTAMHDATQDAQVWDFSDDDDLDSGPASMETETA